MKTEYIVILTSKDGVLGVFHSVQRAKRTAKEIGLSRDMVITEYEVARYQNHHNLFHERWKHEWSGQWYSYHV